jgi:uncharacterized protein (TIGR02453 family)
MSIVRLAEYLTGLTAHNNKEWFEANRVEYTALRAEFTDFVADVIAQTAAFDPSVAHVDAKDALFRINRDLRFSKDKSPYKTTFSASFGSGGRHGGGCGYYLQIDAAGELHDGAGLHQPESPVLNRVRDSIVSAPDEFGSIIRDSEFVREFGTINGERLKRLPAGVPADAPFPDELRLTSFWVGKARNVKDASWSDLATTVAGDYRAANPFLTWLRRATET